MNAIDLVYQFWGTQHVGKLGGPRIRHAVESSRTPRPERGLHRQELRRHRDPWDRLFGTFQEELDEEPVVYGVRKPLANWNPFWANTDYLWFDAKHTRRWRDKLGIWFRRTGWRPADVAERYPKQPSDITAFEKFDPPVAR